MTIIAVDDERAALEAIEEAIRQAAPDAELRGFSEAARALDFARETRVDVAFLDIRMPGMDGLTLARALKETNPAVNIIFTTGYSQYAQDAFSLYASGYVTKPVNAEAVRRELANLRHAPGEEEVARVCIQCFGGFAVYVRGALLHFSRAKPKELLAYLVHKNGTSSTVTEMSAVLWEDRPYNRSTRSQMQTVISQLMLTLREAGIEDIITKKWNSIAIDKAKVQCDYYDFLDGKPQAVSAYIGEYLTDYSWAESVAAEMMTSKETK